MEIRKATFNEINDVENFYNNVNDYLAKNTNYSGWKNGIYPTRFEAENGFNEGGLYVVIEENMIIGTFILMNESIENIENIKWGIDVDDNEIVSLQTFAISPKAQGNGIGSKVLEWIEERCKDANIKSIRLSTYENNLPAIRLYEKNNFKFIEKVDLGYGDIGLDWFNLYEKVL